MSLNCFHSWLSAECLEAAGVLVKGPEHRLQLRPCPPTGCTSLENSVQVSGDLVQGHTWSSWAPA